MLLSAGNDGLCGKPLDRSCKKIRLSGTLLILIIVLAASVALGFSAAIFALLRRRSSASSESRFKLSPTKSAKMAASHKGHKLGNGSPTIHTTGAKTETVTTKDHAHDHEKLTFLRDGAERFEFKDLLRASAEVLGGGGFGSSYKAVLLTGQAMVVKRFKEMNTVGREEFHHHMRRLGRLSHPNVLSLTAYYYRKEEKLLVTEYIKNSSLVHLLHSKLSFFFQK